MKMYVCKCVFILYHFNNCLLHILPIDGTNNRYKSEVIKVTLNKAINIEISSTVELFKCFGRDI